MKNLFLIQEYEGNDVEGTIIGISDSIERSEEMIEEYFGKYQLLKKEDIRDSGLEYIYHIEWKDSEGKIKSKVVLSSHELNYV